MLRTILIACLLLPACACSSQSSVVDGDGLESETIDGDIEHETDTEPEGEGAEAEVFEIDSELEPDIEAEAESLPEWPEYPKDHEFRINQIQVKGTHNSYHIYEETPLPIFGGDLAPLDVQAKEQGVRQFEIDVHYDPDRGFVVYHTIYGDAGSNCEYLSDCLALLKTWSDRHPGHHVLFIFIEPKDDMDPLQMLDKSEQLDDLILLHWPMERLIRPDDLRGGHATLRAAIEADGWPSLAAGRDKSIFFYFDSDQYRDAYLDNRPNAEGRVMFPRSDKQVDSPIGAFVNFDDPKADSDRILQFAQAGFLIRTRTDVASQEPSVGDYTRIDAALASAAQMISTDYPIWSELYDYVFDIPDGKPSRCNPHLAPAACRASDVENLPE